MSNRQFRRGMLVATMCVLVSGVALADSGWFWQNPLPQGNWLRNVALVNANTVFAVGDLGTILKSTNGGATWTLQSSGTTSDLWGISFTDANTGTAVGRGGTILRTTNGGATWAAQPSGTPDNLWSVSCTDANNCWAVGDNGTILRTINGGATWSTQSSGTTANLYGVSFTDANTGIAVGGDIICDPDGCYQFGQTILRTTNGGATWSVRSDATAASLDAVSCTDANNCTAVGDSGTILRTTNGGATWSAQSSATYANLYGVSFTDANTGTAVGWGPGTILHTANGGATWSTQSTGTTADLEGVSFTDANTGTAVGASGTILHTTNGGATWGAQSSTITTSSLYGVSCTDTNNCTAVGGPGTILHTINAGATWSAQSSGTTAYLSGISCTDPNNCTAVGDSGTILRTTNGGTTWALQSSGIAETLWGVSFTDANTGTAVGNNGKILRTTNGGATWIQQTGNPYILNSVSCTDANTCTAVGATILRTTNGGATWIQQTGNPYILNGVSCTDANTCVAVGALGTILRTNNGGATWITQSSGTAAWLVGISLSDGNTGTAVGYLCDYYDCPSSTILRTTNGGATWTAQSTGARAYLLGVSFTDANTCTAVGGGGTILRTNTGGISDTSITLTSSINPSIFGQSVTFTATVSSPGPAAPTGTVTLKDGTTALATAALSGGPAVFSIPSLPVGTHLITAVYSGDGSFNSSTSAPLAQVVNRAATMTAISSVPNPSIFGQSVTFTAAVVGQFGGTPTGTVIFSIDGIPQSPSPLNGGVATFSTATLTPGQRAIAGVYSGDSNFGGSTSANFTQVVNRAPTRTTITSSVNPSLVGQSVTFTATVTGQPGTPTGTVTFSIDGALQSPSTLSGGVATFPTITLTQGLHIVLGVYSGDSNFAPSTSANFIQVVNSATQAVTTTTMTANTDRKTPGQPSNSVYLREQLTLTAQVTSGTSGTLTGSVTFRDGGVLIGTPVPVDTAGRASLPAVQLTLGSHSLMAIYGGDTTFGGSLSAPLVIQRSPKPR